jgi:hypothetical protein
VALRAQSGQPGGPRAAARFRAALVTTQIALSVTLLIVAGLLAKSLANVASVQLGLNADHVLMFSVSPRLNGYKPEDTLRFIDQAREAIGALPGVTGATTTSVALLAGNNWGTSVSVQGFEAGPDADTGVNANYIGPNFFRTMEGRMLVGREFTAADTLDAPKVAIVNEAFARPWQGRRGQADGHGPPSRTPRYRNRRPRRRYEVQRDQERHPAADLPAVLAGSVAG